MKLFSNIYLKFFCNYKNNFTILFLVSFLGYKNYAFSADYSLSFDGSTNYVDFPFDASMNPTGDFSVNVWVKTGASSDYQSAVTSRTDTINGDEGGGFMVYIAADEEWSFWAGDGADDDTWAQVNSTTDINIGTWQMQTVTFQESTNVMKLYVDGVMIANGNNARVPIVENTNQRLYIGAGRTNKYPHIPNNADNKVKYHFNGKIDEVGIWSSTLSDAEIVQLYNGGETLYAGENYGDYASSGSLSEYWSMDDEVNGENNGTGSSTLFGEINNNDGTLINSPSWDNSDFPGTAPTLSSSSPSDNETDVDCSTNIVLNFSEIIKIGSGNITLKKASDDSVVQTFNVETDATLTSNTQITLNPSSDLEINSDYYVQIDATAIIDISRNNYAGIPSTDKTTYNFSTGTTRSNPLNNKDVVGLIEAQTSAPKKILSHVISPIFNRLNWIRGYSLEEDLKPQSINLNFVDPKLKKLSEVLFQSINYNKPQKNINENWLFWSEGSVSVGGVGSTKNSSRKDISSNAITLGFDKKTDEKTVQGYTITYTDEDVDVSNKGTSTDIDAYSFSTYRTLNIGKNKYLEGILGLSMLDFKNIRKDGNNTLNGDRDGNQVFGSLHYINTFKKDNRDISPNFKLDISYTTLDDYSEKGINALQYDKQTVETLGISGGFIVSNEILKKDFILRPSMALDFGYDLSPSSDVSLNYVSDSNTKYTKSIDQEDDESIKGKIGFDILNETGLSMMFFYERFQTENSHSDTLYFLTGYVTHRNEEFVLELENETARINFNQDINGFDVKLSSNYNLLSEIDDYGATIELAKKF
ncbi:autotransporter domain-containing protein [Candidatus Pelagibacter communis]|uniref:autotransporter domain-containing protein n=1 Tax=Pelagibacter ubique TaxID=198252 RepID=UPI00094CF0B7|nr:autotransporter domain-containing protein [Candidatus Pelagibacter ubique]